MDEKTFTDKCAAYQANSAIHRTYIHAFIGFVVALGVLGGFVLTWEHQLKREALINQEVQATWAR